MKLLKHAKIALVALLSFISTYKSKFKLLNIKTKSKNSVVLFIKFDS